MDDAERKKQLNNMSVAKLKDLCKQHRLSHGGRVVKNVLVDRVRECLDSTIIATASRFVSFCC